MWMSSFIGLGALLHGSQAATLLKGVEPILFKVFAFPVSFNYEYILDTVT